LANHTIQFLDLSLGVASLDVVGTSEAVVLLLAVGETLAERCAFGDGV
jgi:hypothetical protein